MTRAQSSFVRAHLAVCLAVVCVTAWSSYAYFHLDEYFQVLELTYFKLGISPAWTLPWEHASQIRPWMQPWLYWLVARVLSVVGVTNVFSLAFAFRLLTGVVAWGALAAFLRTTLPWLGTEDEKRLHVRVATLLGFLPYLFVRTSSETMAMSAFTIAFALSLRGAEKSSARKWSVPASPIAMAWTGVLLGLAFEFRFQSAFMSLGLLVWLWRVGRVDARRLGLVVLGGVAALGLGALVDRWGYGEWTFPALTYVQANLLEGAAAFFGTEPPFAYLWLLPANIFFPVVVVFLVLAVIAWVRHPRHPVTWTTLPFFVIHCLVAHKEERFVFPIAILGTMFVVMALGPSEGRPLGIATALWKRRSGLLGRALVLWNVAMMVLLASWPIGWNHHVRFQRHTNVALGGELRAYALPDFDLGLPAFHGAVYDIEKASGEEIARRVEHGAARAWLVTDAPLEPTSPLASHATLVWSEVPFFGVPALAGSFERLTTAYDAIAKPPLRQIRYRRLYSLE